MFADPAAPPAAGAPAPHAVALAPTTERPSAATDVHRGLGRALPLALVVGTAVGWAALFGWLALERHLAGGSHAEDLGFTDQVLANFLHGQAFRMSIYQGATWNTELDIARLARPDSLLAFHVEPLLLLLVPLYAVGGNAAWLVVLQAVAVAAGAVPAFRLGRHASGATLAGLAVAGAYLLSPLGQWAVLADVHTSTLAIPLLLLALERLLVAGAARQALVAIVLALGAREDVGPVVAALGLLLMTGWGVPRRPLFGALSIGLGLAWTALSVVILHHYAGPSISPFGTRYADLLTSGPLGLLSRPLVLDYARTLLLSGGWLGALAPLAWLPALPTLALNSLASSPWMASGRAHYSALVLPFVTLSAALALGRLRRWPRLVPVASLLLLLGSLGAYLERGTGPLGGDYAPARLTPHAEAAAVLAASLPSEAAVSATSALVPRVSRRAHVYVFPAVLDADYVFLDLQAGSAPTSPGDVYLRVQALLESGGWTVEHAEDGLLLLDRADDAPPVQIASLGARLFPPQPEPTPSSTPVATGADDTSDLVLLDARLQPSADGARDVDGPRWVLHTTWRANRPLPPGTRLDFWLDLTSGQRVHIWDVASLWWNPPDQWPVGQPMAVDVPEVPVHDFVAWQWSRR